MSQDIPSISVHGWCQMLQPRTHKSWERKNKSTPRTQASSQSAAEFFQHWIGKISGVFLSENPSFFSKTSKSIFLSWVPKTCFFFSTQKTWKSWKNPVVLHSGETQLRWKMATAEPRGSRPKLAYPCKQGLLTHCYPTICIYILL